MMSARARMRRERRSWPVRSDGTAEEAAPPEGTAKDGARGTGPALEAHYRFLPWLVPAVERFPRNRKLLLGDRTKDCRPRGAVRHPERGFIRAWTLDTT